MSKVALEGNINGTGTFTIASPNSNTSRTLTLPDQSGTFALGGNPASFSALTVGGNNISAVNGNWRNRIINGDMVIDQRNNGASISVGVSNVFPVDRFIARLETATGTGQRSSVAPAGFSNSLFITTGTGAAPSAGAPNTISQRIEGFNVADLSWGTASAQAVTLSFWVRSSITGTYAFRVGNGSRSYVATYTVTTANTFEQKSITIPGDTTGTWATDNSVGMFLNWDLGSGSNFNTTAGAWQVGDFLRAAGTVNLVATTGATFYITGVQLEAGSVATPFERLPYGTELALCQRYFQMKSTVAIPVSATSNIFPATHFMVQMRAIPTLAVSFDVGTGATYGALANANSVYQIQNHSAVATATISLNSEL